MKKNKENKDKVERHLVVTENAPKAIGPYSQGVALKKLVFFSGQIAIDPKSGNLIDGDIVAQTKQILLNIDALLKSQELTSLNVVKTTVYITDITRFGEVNAEYATYFAFDPPARSCVGVSALPQNAQIEIDVIASR